MYIKRAILAAAITLAMTSSLFAQPQGRQTPQERAKTEVATLKTELTLNSDQEQKIYDIMVADSEKMKQARQAGTEDREAMRAKMDSMRTAQQTKIKAELTDDQITKYNAYIAKKQKEIDQRRNR